MLEGQELATTHSFVSKLAYKTPLEEYLGHSSTHLSVVSSKYFGQVATQEPVESSLWRLPAHYISHVCVSSFMYLTLG